MRSLRLVLFLTLTGLLVLPTSAFADITAFWGFSSTPARRTTTGFAVGVNLLVAGFEFEYGNTRESEIDGAPSLRTGMFNGLVQTPTGGVQLYFTAGGGFYRERWRDVQESNFGTNIGGGVKLALAGPLRARIDYRVFHLRGEPLYRNPKRFYVGANLSF